MTEHKPLIIAHRGASGLEPENTMLAFEKAVALGADGIELDVFLTADNKVVVTHDRKTTRITGKKSDVCKSTFKDLRKLDFGKKEKIPLLSEVLDAFADKLAVINVEIKSMGVRNNGIEQHVTDVLRNYNLDKFVVSSFNPIHLYRMRKILPEVRYGYLVCREQIKLVRNRFAVVTFGPDTLNLDQNLYKEKRHRVFFKLKYPQWVWTVNTLDQMSFWSKRPNIEALITNYPDKLRKILHG